MSEPAARGPEVFFEDVRGVAVVGASTDPKKAGHQIVRNMLDAGFPGGVYPVSPSGAEVAGLAGYRSLASIPGPVDLVVIASPVTVIGPVLEDLERRLASRGDVRAVVTVAAGFGETGRPEGAAAQARLIDLCRRHGVRELGPNCVGIIDNGHRLDTTFIVGTRRRAGGVSMISQSGAFGAWLVSSWSAQPSPAGICKFSSLGNMADLELVELLEYLGRDSATRVIGMYLEGHPQARRLVEAAGRIVPTKPVVVLKVGRTEQGATAAHSHTGSMAGSDRLYDAAFRQFGIARVETADELSDTLQAFDSLPLPRGPRVFLATQAGGPGTYLADILASLADPAEGGIRPALVSEDTKRDLTAALPPFASVCQPEGYCDITAAASIEQHANTVELLLRDPGVDALILVTVPTLYLPSAELGAVLVEAYRRVSGHVGPKPFLPVILAGDVARPGRKVIGDSGLPTFETPERAARALRNLVRHSAFVGGWAR